MQNSFVADCKLTQALERRSTSVSYVNGGVLFKQGEPPKGLYILKRGNASLMMKAEDNTEILRLTVGPGSILGVPAVVTKEPYTLGARASARSKVEFVELNDFEELMRSDPSLFPLVLAVLAAEVRAGRIALTRIMTKLASRHSRSSARVLLVR